MRYAVALLLQVCLLAASLGCGGREEVPEPNGSLPPLSVASPAFADGEPIPAEFTCDGEDRSLPLAWASAPAGAASFAIVMDDPDAPGGTFVHWVVANIPPSLVALDAGASGRTLATLGVLEGRNDFKRTGYGGPCPPVRDAAHRYQVTVYAVDSMLDFEEDPSKAELLKAITGHVIAAGTLTGTFDR